MPFLKKQLAAIEARRVLDVACGTGQHAIALAQQGYDVVGADLSAAMVARARENAAAAGVDVQFVTAGFGQLAGRVGDAFDALLCLGNSLPHVKGPQALRAALADFAQVLRPGGLGLVQIRNFNRVMAQQERWMQPLSHQEGDREWVFLRFYDFLPDGKLAFHVVALEREKDAPWQSRVRSTVLYPILYDELVAALEETGFSEFDGWGNVDGSDFAADASPNLIVTAHRS
jgi:SAM-dependent methyltransferase